MVTGGAKRVGRAIVLELARGGCDVAIHYHHSQVEALELAEQLRDMGRRALAIGGDLGDSASWPAITRQCIDGMKRLDILVNNAAAFPSGQPDGIDDFSANRWEATLRTNLIAPMALCHFARPYLVASGQGKIVNLSDICAERPWPKYLAYCASKAALSAMTKSLARALAPEIQVNGVAPGIALFGDQFPSDKRDALAQRVPLGRAGTPQEVAELVRFLVESGDYITGQTIPIDGGRSLA